MNPPLKAYLINLPERKDRLDAFKERFRGWSLDLEVLPGVKHAEPWRGCALSHLAVVQKAKAAGLPWVLILEDDAAPTEPTPERFNTLLPILWSKRSEWEIFNGGPSLVKAAETSIVQKEPPLLKTKGQAAHFILMNATAFDTILKDITQKDQQIIDLYYRNTFRMFATVPLIATQAKGHSTIDGKFVDYEGGLKESEAVLCSVLEGKVQAGGRRKTRHRQKKRHRRKKTRTQRGGQASTIPRKVWCFWVGPNQMSKNRKESYDSIVANIGVPVTLVTDQTLKDYIKPDAPIHKAYEFLSGTHKCDYLRTYFMHHYGGGYTDIKRTNTSWIKAFEEIEKDPNIWVNGYKEINAGAVAVPSDNPGRGDILKQNFSILLGNCAYICRPNTEFTKKWIDKLHEKLDRHYEELKKNPASDPRDEKGKRLGNGTVSKYPIGWVEILGEIFHDLCYDYKEHLLYTVPAPDFSNYN